MHAYQTASFLHGVTYLKRFPGCSLKLQVDETWMNTLKLPFNYGLNMEMNKSTKGKNVSRVFRFPLGSSITVRGSCIHFKLFYHVNPDKLAFEFGICHCIMCILVYHIHVHQNHHFYQYDHNISMCLWIIMPKCWLLF